MIIDLTHTIETGMPVYPGTPAPALKDLELYEEHGVNVLELVNVSGHIGTHMDAPKHLFPAGASVAGIDIENFYGSAVVLDCSAYSAGDAIGPEVLEQVENIDNYKFVLLFTGWDKYWGTDKYYDDFPVPSLALAEALAATNIKGIGLDVISVDTVEATDLPVHKKILGSGKIILENLTNLNGLIGKDFNLACFPLKIKNGDGSPIRAAAILQ